MIPLIILMCRPGLLWAYFVSEMHGQKMQLVFRSHHHRMVVYICNKGWNEAMSRMIYSVFFFRLHTHNTCTLTPTNARAFSKIESANSRDWQSHHYAPQNLISGLSLSCRVLETCKSKANSFGGCSPAAGAWWWRVLLFNAHMVAQPMPAAADSLHRPELARRETLISFSLFISLSST